MASRIARRRRSAGVSSGATLIVDELLAATVVLRLTLFVSTLWNFYLAHRSGLGDHSTSRPELDTFSSSHSRLNELTRDIPPLTPSDDEE